MAIVVPSSRPDATARMPHRHRRAAACLGGRLDCDTKDWPDGIAADRLWTVGRRQVLLRTLLRDDWRCRHAGTDVSHSRLPHGCLWHSGRLGRWFGGWRRRNDSQGDDPLGCLGPVRQVVQASRERQMRGDRQGRTDKQPRIANHGLPGATMAAGSIWIANDATPSDFTTSNTQTIRPCDTALSPEMMA